MDELQLAGHEGALPNAEEIRAAEAAATRHARAFEIRGYEVAKLDDDGTWEQVQRFRPTERDMKAAAASAKWLQWRNAESGAIYQMRVLLSAEMPTREQMVEAGSLPAQVSTPLTLDADESPEGDA